MRQLTEQEEVCGRHAWEFGRYIVGVWAEPDARYRSERCKRCGLERVVRVLGNTRHFVGLLRRKPEHDEEPLPR